MMQLPQTVYRSHCFVVFREAGLACCLPSLAALTKQRVVLTFSLRLEQASQLRYAPRPGFSVGSPRLADEGCTSRNKSGGRSGGDDDTCFALDSRTEIGVEGTFAAPAAGGDDDPVESGAVPDEAAELRRVLIPVLSARSSLHARSRRNRCRDGTPLDVVVLLRKEEVGVAAAVRSAEEEEERGGETAWRNAFERIRFGRQSSVLEGALSGFDFVRMRSLFGAGRRGRGKSEMTTASGGPRSKKSRTHWVRARSVLGGRADQ